MFGNAEGILQKIGSVLLALIATISALLGLTKSKIPEGFTPEDTRYLTLAVVSDTHVGNAAAGAVLANGMRDISAAEQAVDAVLVLGDCTDNGNEKNWQTFAKAMEKCTVKEKIILLGNHDTWTSYDTPHDYNEALANYLKYANAVMGTNYDKPRYTRDIYGFRFIVMAPEDTDVSAVVSDEQLRWLDGELAAAKAANPQKPVFVLMHQPMNFTHAVGDNSDNNGFSDNAVSKKLQAILNKYQDVFYMSGHTHFGLNDGTSFDYPEGFTTVERISDTVTSVNLPAYGKPSLVFGGDPLLGDGLIVNVYGDRVEFLGRNFLLNTWVGYNVSVPLTGAQPE